MGSLYTGILHALRAAVVLLASRRCDYSTCMHFLNHHLVLALGLLLTERSSSHTAGKRDTDKRDAVMHPAELSVGNLGI